MKGSLQSQSGDPMILKIDSARCITLPKGFKPGDHVLLIPIQGGGYKLIQPMEASQEEIEQALEGEMVESAAAFRHLAGRYAAP